MAPPPLPPPRGITCAVNAAPTPASPTHHKFFPNMSKPHRFSVPGGQPRHPPESPPWQGVAKGSAGALRPLNPPQNRFFSTHIHILFFHTPSPNTLTFNNVSSAPRHSLSEGWHRAQQTTRARVGGGQRRASLILIFLISLPRSAERSPASCSSTAPKTSIISQNHGKKQEDETLRHKSAPACSLLSPEGTRPPHRSPNTTATQRGFPIFLFFLFF